MQVIRSLSISIFGTSRVGAVLPRPEPLTGTKRDSSRRVDGASQARSPALRLLVDYLPPAYLTLLYPTLPYPTQAVFLDPPASIRLVGLNRHHGEYLGLASSLRRDGFLVFLCEGERRVEICLLAVDLWDLNPKLSSFVPDRGQDEASRSETPPLTPFFRILPFTATIHANGMVEKGKPNPPPAKIKPGRPTRRTSCPYVRFV